MVPNYSLKPYKTNESLSFPFCISFKHHFIAQKLLVLHKIIKFSQFYYIRKQLTLFYTGFFLYVKIRGGVFLTPPWLKLEKWLKLGKRHFLAKIDYCCPLFVHLELNYYHFWPKKGQKNWRRRGSNRGIEGSPLWIVCGKNCRRKIFWKFQKEIPKMAYPGPF